MCDQLSVAILEGQGAGGSWGTKDGVLVLGCITFWKKREDRIIKLVRGPGPFRTSASSNHKVSEKIPEKWPLRHAGFDLGLELYV